MAKPLTVSCLVALLISLAACASERPRGMLADISYTRPDGWHLNVVRARSEYIQDSSPMYYEDAEYDYAGGTFEVCSTSDLLCEKLDQVVLTAPRSGGSDRWAFENQVFTVKSRTPSGPGSDIVVETTMPHGAPYSYVLRCPTGIVSMQLKPDRPPLDLVPGFAALLAGC